MKLVLGAVVLVLWVTFGVAYGFSSLQIDLNCPPFDQCTPSGAWNAPNCECWNK